MSPYPRHRVPPERIHCAVWLSNRLNLSFRDPDDRLAERGITVSNETLCLWCSKFEVGWHAGWLVSGSRAPGTWTVGMRCICSDSHAQEMSLQAHRMRGRVCLVRQRNAGCHERLTPVRPDP